MDFGLIQLLAVFALKIVLLVLHQLLNVQHARVDFTLMQLHANNALRVVLNAIQKQTALLALLDIF